MLIILSKQQLSKIRMKKILSTVVELELYKNKTNFLLQDISQFYLSLYFIPFNISNKNDKMILLT